MRKRTPVEAGSSSLTWETLEDFTRQKVQGFIQALLEAEVTELLGRERSERRAAVDASGGYRNGYGKRRRLSMQGGTIQLRRPRVRGLEERFESLFGISVSNASVTLEALVRFLHGKRFQPYVLGDLGGATLQFNNEVLDTRTSGGTAVLGGRVQYHLSRHLALDLAGRLDLINWDKVEVTTELPDGSKAQLENPVDESGSAAKLMLGLVWNF